MRYLSVCSGIEAATVAWHPLGWQPVAFAEIERFPSAVLAQHYPQVPNWGDLTRFHEWPQPCRCVDAGDSGARGKSRLGSEAGWASECGAHADWGARRDRGRRDSDYSSGGTCDQCGGTVVDLLVGGTPCQSFSVAGLRAGLDDPRGSLMLTYLAVARRYRPRWLVWENVPGVLSADRGRAFGSLLGGLAELGYGFAYRVLDAQYFGLAQRRARVFVVGHRGDWRRAAAVLFERESLSGHPAPRREAGEGIASGAIAGAVSSKWAKGTGGPAGDECYNMTLAHSLRADGFDASEAGTGRGTPLVPTIAFHNRQDHDISGPVSHPLGAKDNGMAIAFTQNQRDEVRVMDIAGALAGEPGMNQQTYVQEMAIAFSAKDSGADSGDIAPTLRSGGHHESHANGGVMPAIVVNMAVRRLTPRECERLQGFPDDYTLIPYRGKLAADGPRYKALGNSMAVPVMRWIGQRIQQVESL